MPRNFGIPPRSAAEQLQRDHTEIAAATPFEPLPAPTGVAPYRLRLSDVLDPEHEQGSAFHVIGDHGGVKDPAPQAAVAAALGKDKAAHADVGFLYSLGDVVYFNGAEAEYGPQFYEPYAQLGYPILAIPGNHDGDPEEDGESSLAAFVANFCAATPVLPAKWAEYQRDVMTQPNPYFTLLADDCTIIGLYSNVPEGGEIKSDQLEWLVGELKAAPTDRPLILGLHHPPLSADAHHGGSELMGKLLDEAFEKAGRCPDLILSGHVHNYQRFSRTYWNRQVPYIVCGAGGYHNLHAMAAGSKAGETLASGVTLEAFVDDKWGFLRLRANANGIEGTYVSVARSGETAEADAFTIPLATS